MTIIVLIEDAQKRLAGLCKLASRGEDVLHTKDGQPAGGSRRPLQRHRFSRASARWVSNVRIDRGPELFAAEMAAFLRHWEDMRTADSPRHSPNPGVDNEAEEEGEHLSSQSPRRRLKAFLSKTPASSTVHEPLHDLIVGRVEKCLERIKIKKCHNAEIDLWAEGPDGGITHTYEIKPSGARDSVYKGVGQLLINRQALLDGGVKSEKTDDIIPVLVVGDDIQAPMAKLARQLGVRIVRVCISSDEKGLTLIDPVPCQLPGGDQGDASGR